MTNAGVGFRPPPHGTRHRTYRLLLRDTNREGSSGLWYIAGFREQRRQNIQSRTRRGKRSSKVVVANRVVEVTSPGRHAQSGRVGGVYRFEASSMANGRARRRLGCAQHTLMPVAPKRNTPGPKGRNSSPGKSAQEPDEPERDTKGCSPATLDLHDAPCYDPCCKRRRTGCWEYLNLHPCVQQRRPRRSQPG